MHAAPAPFVPTRDAGLARLAAFLPRAGVAYARNRNHDTPDPATGQAHVSALSPWLRHRLVTEPEVLRAVVARHGAAAADKFIAEIYWRTYWKGWLQMRPGVWSAYRAGLAAAHNRLATEEGLRRRWADACAGQTGIAGFDDWAQDLPRTGWLHNHARMWFASIWIFTLGLPWQLGADFFLRHLIDGDAASNTLSWRWVGGLQTQGKTYLATADNIAMHTGGRFRPDGLARVAHPLVPEPAPPVGPLPVAGQPLPRLATGLILHDDDLDHDWASERTTGRDLRACAILTLPNRRSPGGAAPLVAAFVAGAADDAAARIAVPVTRLTEADGLLPWAVALDLQQVIVPQAPVGWTADALRPALVALQAAGIRVVRQLRPHDADAWPHATHGFFRFREAIPDLLGRL